MNEAIHQNVQFKNTTATELFNIYTYPEKHAAVHNGAETKITKHEGDSFSLLNGKLTGKNLKVVPNRIIVQT